MSQFLVFALYHSLIHTFIDSPTQGVVILTGMRTRVGSIATLLARADEDVWTPSTGSEPTGAMKDRQVRQRSLSHEYEKHLPSDIEYENDLADEEMGDSTVVETNNPQSNTVCSLNVFGRIRKTVASYQPKKTPLQEGTVLDTIMYVNIILGVEIE